jgi:hypothetical protein
MRRQAGEQDQGPLETFGVMFGNRVGGFKRRAGDVIRGELAVEDADLKRADLQRHIHRLGVLVEQADILFHQIQREGDIARAVQDQLAFGFMHEKISA